MGEQKEATVYIVDDDDAVRRSLERLMRSVGLAVEVFSSAQDFLSHKISEGPTCIVLDVRMPGLSGLDLQEKLAESELDIPVIFMTGHGAVPMSVRAIERDRRTRKQRAARLEARRRLHRRW